VEVAMFVLEVVYGILCYFIKTKREKFWGNEETNLEWEKT
jgi:hypothetical protein